MMAKWTTATYMGAKREHPRTPGVSAAPQKEPVTSPMVGTAAKIRTKAGITVVPALAVTYQPPQRGRPIVCKDRR